MWIVPALSGVTTGNLYRRFVPSTPQCRAGERHAVIVSTGELDTPDRIAASGVRSDLRSFEVELKVRRFEGSIRANDPWIALIRMDVGVLDGGDYRLVVREETLRFGDPDHPEDAESTGTTERTASFECV